jgi:poxvirus D5 protein-like
MSTSSVLTNIFNRIPSHIRKFTFPLRPFKKTPAQGVFWKNWEMSNWQDSDYSSSTGYGILTERADLIVIDCDVKGDVNGLDSFLNLCYRNNYNPDEHTLSVNTPSGGRHYYFLAHQRYESGARRIRSSVSKILPGVDVRADGGYIVGFGSVIDNGSYTLASSVRAVDQVPDWLYGSLLYLQEPQQNSLLGENKNSDSSTVKSMTTNTTENSESVSKDRKFSVVSEESGASMSSNDKSASEHNSSSISENNSADSKDSVDWEDDPYTSEILRRCVKALSKAGEGTRNKALFDKAFCCGANGVPHDKAVDALSDEAMKIGLSIGEIIRTTSRAWSEGRKKFDSPDGYRKVLDERQEWMRKNTPSGSGSDSDDVEIPSLEDSWSWSAPAMAERILDKHHIRYVPGKSNNGEWYVYSPKTGIWEKSTSVKEIVTQEMKVLSRALDAKDAKQKARSVVTYRFISEITSSMKFMCNIDENKFDSNPYLRCVENGVLDLRTGQLSPYDPSLLMSKRIDVAYKPGAADNSKLLRQVLSAMPEDAIDWAQVMFGQAMFGLQPSSSVVTFMHGSGANGKSAIMNLLKKTMGTYSSELSKSAFNFRSTDSKYALYQMRGVSQTILEELPKGVNLDIDTLKEIAGTETIVARGVCKDFIEFENMLSVFVSTNHLPKMQAHDYGSRRRLAVLPFPYRFVSAEKHKNDPRPNDRMAYGSLTQDASSNTPLLEAFLAWRVQGAVRWWKAGGQGRYQLEANQPKSVSRATSQWIDSTNPVQQFFNDCLVKEEGYCAPVSNLYQVFKTWAEGYGHKNLRMDKGDFSNKMKEQFNLLKTTGSKGNQVSTKGVFRADRRSVMFQGVRFTNEQDVLSEDVNEFSGSDSIYNHITSEDLLNDFQDSTQDNTDSADNTTNVTKSIEALEPETVQADDDQATHQEDVSETTDVESVLPEVLQDDEQATINTDSISPAIEQKRIETGVSVEISDDVSNSGHTTAPSTQESEINGGFNHDEPVVSETDIMVLDSVLMTCSDAWENLDDLCQCYGTHNLVTPEGERLELEEILRLLYQNSMTLPDIIIAINTNREHVSRKRE